MRVLGIDFGLKRVGLALTDPDNIMAFPLLTIERTTRAEFFDRLLAAIADNKVERIALGLPVDMDGQETLITRQVRNFAASLARRIDMPIDFVDERLSSHEAARDLAQGTLKGHRKKKAVLDQRAAVLILETWLNENRKSKSGGMAAPDTEGA